MCGRYDLNQNTARIADLIGARQLLLDDWRPHYNIAPGRHIPMAHIADESSEQTRVLAPSWWGFRPRWAKTDAPAPINARAEKVATSPYFRRTFSRHRCLIPASGWYEWRQTDSGKQPYHLAHADGELLMFAGTWTSTEEDGGTRCAIITELARVWRRTSTRVCR